MRYYIYGFNRLNKQEYDYMCISACSEGWSTGAHDERIARHYISSLASSKRKSERFGAIQILVKLIDHG
jgi:hypothetical protein